MLDKITKKSQNYVRLTNYSGCSKEGNINSPKIINLYPTYTEKCSVPPQPEPRVLRAVNNGNKYKGMRG